MQGTHTFAEPALPGGPSSFRVFWGLSTKSKKFSHLFGCRKGASCSPCDWRWLSPGAPASVLVPVEGWAAGSVPVAQRALLPSLARAGEQHGLSARKPPDSPPLWRVEEGICNVLIT